VRNSFLAAISVSQSNFSDVMMKDLYRPIKAI